MKLHQNGKLCASKEVKKVKRQLANTYLIKPGIQNT